MQLEGGINEGIINEGVINTAVGKGCSAKSATAGEKGIPIQNSQWDQGFPIWNSQQDQGFPIQNSQRDQERGTIPGPGRPGAGWQEQGRAQPSRGRLLDF